MEPPRPRTRAARHTPAPGTCPHQTTYLNVLARPTRPPRESIRTTPLHPTPINYRIRRVIAADPDVLTQALRRTTGSEPSPILLRHFWETLTGGDIALAPPPLGISEDSPNYTMFTTERPDFHHEYKQAFTHALNYLQNEHGMPSDEPLIWSPPP